MSEHAGYAFYRELARVLNSGQSRSVLLSGNVHDLYWNGSTHVPLADYVRDRSAVDGVMVVTLELNGPLRTTSPRHATLLRDAYVSWRLGTVHASPDMATLVALTDPKAAKKREMMEAEFARMLTEATGQPTVALELLRQLSMLSRASDADGRAYLPEKLVIIIEAADLLVPAGGGRDIAQLAPADRHRVAILRDWFCEPGFLDGQCSVVMLADSASGVHPLIAGLPGVYAIEVSSPDEAEREHFVRCFQQQRESRSLPAARLWADAGAVARATAGLTLHALRQLLVRAAHTGEEVVPASITPQVERFIASELGEDVVEFSTPSHSLRDVVGNTRLKQFLDEELIPRFRAGGDAALPGAAVAGPIGSGKTFIFEAVASSLGMPVLTLKNIRSQWYGQTDAIFEKLRRTLEALGKVVIFVDEADTQFGGVGPDAHETERRLTGKIQQMMSDPRLRGKVIWLLMTARIHLLSPDIRRPGRVGDLIIPVLDPEGEDREAFLAWTIRGLLDPKPGVEEVAGLATLTSEYSAASFAALRSALKARVARVGRSLSLAEAEATIGDIVQPAISATRRYQTLQALLNCTRKSLLPDPSVGEAQRAAWEREVRALEAMGVR